MATRCSGDAIVCKVSGVTAYHRDDMDFPPGGTRRVSTRRYYTTASLRRSEAGRCKACSRLLSPSGTTASSAVFSAGRPPISVRRGRRRCGSCWPYQKYSNFSPNRVSGKRLKPSGEDEAERWDEVGTVVKIRKHQF